MNLTERLWKYLLVLSLELVLVIPTCSHQSHDRGIRSPDQYWSQTGLTDKELRGLLSDQSCYLNQTQFLACASAVATAAEKQGLYFDTDGSFRPLQAFEVSQRLSEKRYLKQWENKFDISAKVSFWQAWEEAILKVPEQFKSTRIAEALNAYLSIIKDPHSYLIPLAQYEETVANHETRESGSGMVVKPSQAGLVIRKVLKGSPADIARLKKGDVIFEINGRKVQEISRSEIHELLKFKASNRLGLLVNTSNGLVYRDMFKREGTYESVEAKMLNNRIGLGLIVIHKFARNTCEHVRTKIIDLKELGLRGLILDLRDNPGGLVSEAACVISQFVQKGRLLFETRYLDSFRSPDYYFAEEDPVYSGSLAVTVNSGSASAAEIVAGSLKDLDRATLIGETTFGKGSFQDGHVWGGNEKIALFQTEGLYFFPSGWTAQLVGVQPHLQVEFNYASDSREQDLYFNPIRPKSAWTRVAGMTKALSINANCLIADEQPWIAGQSIVSELDPQIEMATQLVSCGGANGRHGSL